MTNSTNNKNYNYTVKVFTDIDAIVEISHAWNKLSGSKGAYLPWRCFEWFKMCYDYSTHQNIKLMVYAVYNENTLVAALPVCQAYEKYKGVIKSNVVRIVGNVNSSIKSVIYGDGDENIETVVRLLFEALTDNNNSFDILELDKLPAEDKITGEIIKYLKACNIRYRTNISFVNWYVDGIDCSSKVYLDNLPSALKKDVQYCKRRLEKEGKLEFLVIKDVNDIDTYLELYDSVRDSSWKAPEKDKKFIRDFTAMSASKGWLRLGFLLYDEKPIAAQKWFICQDYAHIYDVLYAEDYKKYSPGKVLSQMMFEYAIDNDNVTCIDYLQGDESYKREWTNKQRERKEIVIFNKTFRGMLYFALLAKIKPLLSKYHINVN
jgi:Acetyltransferase (GNAT) domain